MDTTESNLRRYALILLAACGISLAITTALLKSQPVAETAVGTEQIAPIHSADQLTIKLAQEVDRKDQLGIAAKDLKSGEYYSLADTREFDAASTMKVLFVAYLYHQASDGNVDLDEVVRIPNSMVQHYGTGSIQYESGPYRYSYRELATRMMHESDNTAAAFIADKFGLDKLQDYATWLGLNDTKVDGNKTTPRDMLNLFTKLYQGELANPELTQEMVKLTQHTAFEDRIPARLPADALISHKTGDAFNGGFHDVGVVDWHGKTYVVALYGEGLSKDDLADMSRDIFGYMTR